MPSHSSDPGGSSDNRLNSGNSSPQQDLQNVLLYPTTVRVDIPTNVFQASAWGNIALKHFEFDSRGIGLISQAETELSPCREVALHYYEIISKAENSLRNFDAKLWRRFLLAGPDPIENEDVPQQKNIDPIDVAFASILFSVTCLCRAEALTDRTSPSYLRWREAGFITCAHILTELSQSFSYESYTGPMPIVRLQEKMEELAKKSAGSLRLQNAISELIDGFNSITHGIESLKKENGVLGDRLFSLSSEQIADTHSTIRKNHSFLRILQEEIQTQVPRDLWIGADDAVHDLVSPSGGHLCCVPDEVYDSVAVKNATLGILREVNRKVDQIFLLGSGWVDPIVSADSSLQKRAPQDIINHLHYWMQDPEDTTSLESSLKIPVDSEKLDNVFAFFRVLKENQKTSKATLEINVNPNIIRDQDITSNVLIVGKNTWNSFFLTTEYKSLMITRTKPEAKLDLSKAVTAEDGIIYLRTAAHAVAESPYGCGPWRTGNIPGEALHLIADRIKQESTELQFSTYFRTSAIKQGQPESARYHTNYVFIHEAKGDRTRRKHEAPKDHLILT